MLTDDEARTLLHRAADTIEVGPGAPLPAAPPRRRWPLLVAAAVVLAIAVGGVVLTRGDDGEPAPATPPKSEPVEHAEVLDPDQIPSVLGYDLDQARRLLENKGMHVVVRKDPGRCQPRGLVTGTEPSVGARFDPGETVTVFVTTPRGVANCEGAPPWPQIWALIQFARGRSDRLEVADELTLYVENGDPVTITREQAADPDSWTVCDNGECHSALAAIEQMATRTWERGVRPFIEVTDQACRDGVPEQRAWTIEFWIGVPTDGVLPGCPAPSVAIALDPDTGTLTGVRLRPLILEESDVPPEPTQTQRSVADAFVAWARGDSAPPPFADEVELLLSDDPWETVTAAEASDRDRWAMCSGVAAENCTVNPLRVIDDFDQTLYPNRILASCGAPDPRHLPDHLADAVDKELVALSEAEPRNCEVYFTVELWITEDGKIRAVNFLP